MYVQLMIKEADALQNPDGVHLCTLQVMLLVVVNQLLQASNLNELSPNQVCERLQMLSSYLSKYIRVRHICTLQWGRAVQLVVAVALIASKSHNMYICMSNNLMSCVSNFCGIRLEGPDCHRSSTAWQGQALGGSVNTHRSKLQKEKDAWAAAVSTVPRVPQTCWMYIEWQAVLAEF